MITVKRHRFQIDTGREQQGNFVNVQLLQYENSNCFNSTYSGEKLGRSEFLYISKRYSLSCSRHDGTGEPENFTCWLLVDFDCYGHLQQVLFCNSWQWRGGANIEERCSYYRLCVRKRNSSWFNLYPIWAMKLCFRTMKSIISITKLLNFWEKQIYCRSATSIHRRQHMHAIDDFQANTISGLTLAMNLETWRTLWTCRSHPLLLRPSKKLFMDVVVFLQTNTENLSPKMFSFAKRNLPSRSFNRLFRITWMLSMPKKWYFMLS